MKAIVYTQYGTPGRLQCKEVDQPTPKDGEVLVKIHAASVNSWDLDLLRGDHLLIRLLSGLTKPRHTILGADIAGIVEAAGNNTAAFKPGDAVFGDIAGCGFGGFAEYVAVPEKLLAKKSPAMTYEQAAALPQAGLLALQGLRYKRGTWKSGQQVLINGAGGGVGTIALQLARQWGAEVTCVDKEEKFDMLRSLGAVHLIDYTTTDYTRNGKQYDFILDVTARRSITDYRRALKANGTFAMIGGSMGGLLLKLMLMGPLISSMGSKKLGIMGYHVNRKDLDTLSQYFEGGKLLPVIDSSLPLTEVPAAMQRLADGNAQGKIVITIAH